MPSLLLRLNALLVSLLSEAQTLHDGLANPDSNWDRDLVVAGSGDLMTPLRKRRGNEASITA